MACNCELYNNKYGCEISSLLCVHLEPFNYILRNADGSSAVFKFLSLGVTYALYTLDELEEKQQKFPENYALKLSQNWVLGVKIAC